MTTRSIRYEILESHCAILDHNLDQFILAP